MGVMGGGQLGRSSCTQHRDVLPTAVLDAIAASRPGWWRIEHIRRPAITSMPPASSKWRAPCGDHHGVRNVTAASLRLASKARLLTSAAAAVAG